MEAKSDSRGGRNKDLPLCILIVLSLYRKKMEGRVKGRKIPPPPGQRKAELLEHRVFFKNWLYFLAYNKPSVFIFFSAFCIPN